MATTFDDIVIDPEFAALIPPLSAEERQQLEENIVEHGGARDPLVVWATPPEWMSGAAEEIADGGDTVEPLPDDELIAIVAKCEADMGHRSYPEVRIIGRTEHWALMDVSGHVTDDDCKYGSHSEQEWYCVYTGECANEPTSGTLLDGHNRHEICTRLGLPFSVHAVVFKSRDEAADWIDKNQLGRRNLTADSFRLLLGRRTIRAQSGQGYRSDLSQNAKSDSVRQVADEAGVDLATAYRAAKFAKEVESCPELQKAILERKPVVQVKRELKEKAREERREENRKKIAAVPEPEKAAAVADAKFATIVIDPPWDWGDEGDQDQLGRARPDYSTMSIEQLEKLDVGKLADDDCHIYLWITNRSLPKGFRLLEAWGFRYITAITWVKPHFGMGNYFRGQTEHVLFGVKGSQPLKRKDVGTVFESPRGEGGHSSKPAAFLELVESCSPGPYIEMFSRSARDGWITWGENADGAA